MAAIESRVKLVVVLLIVVGGILPLVASGLVPGWIPGNSGEVRELPFREASLLEQWAAVLTGFVVKPAYEILALVLAVVLWRQKAADLAALSWGFLFFFIGENFCAANYLLYGEQSLVFEYFHSYGMVVSFAFAAFAIFEGIDGRILKLSDPQGRCAALGLCQRCIKHADVPCGLRRVFLLVLPALMILCLAPLCAELLTASYNTEILGTCYNYSHAVPYQVFENRYCPAAALALFAASLAALAWKKREPVLWSKVLFAAATGALGFSLFRMVFFHAYRENLAWSGIWEELTELLFVVSAAVILWLFRRVLFVKGAGPAVESLR